MNRNALTVCVHEILNHKTNMHLWECRHDVYFLSGFFILQWRHDGCDGVLNHQPRDCLLNRLFGRRSEKTSKLRVTGLCAGNSPVTGEFPAQMASNAENGDVVMNTSTVACTLPPTYVINALAPENYGINFQMCNFRKKNKKQAHRKIE